MCVCLKTNCSLLFPLYVCLLSIICYTTNVTYSYFYICISICIYIFFNPSFCSWIFHHLFFSCCFIYFMSDIVFFSYCARHLLSKTPSWRRGRRLLLLLTETNRTEPAILDIVTLPRMHALSLFYLDLFFIYLA